VFKSISIKAKQGLLVILICFCTWNGLHEKFKAEALENRDISSREIKIYGKCIELIKKSDSYNMINDRFPKKYKIDSVFSTSSINNFKDEIQKNSIFEALILKDQAKVFDIQINSQRINNTRLLLIDTLIDNHDKNVLISFSKPHEKYITAFVQDLQKFGSSYKKSEQVVGNILFLIEEDEIVEYYERTAIYEIY